MSTGPEIASVAVGTKTIQKLRLRILPFVLLLFVVALIDRNNVAFAALTMNKELGITSQQFGLMFGIFYFGYFTFEIPSNLLLHKVGASVWIALILISWGIVATLGGVVHTVHQLFIVRFLLGVAEAGYFPVSHLLVPAKRTGAGLRAFYYGHACYDNFGGSDFWLHFGPHSLARPQQLAVASDSGGSTSHSSGWAHVLYATQPARRRKVSDPTREGMD